MNLRQRVLTVFKRGKPDRIPWEISFAPAVLEMVKREVGGRLEDFLQGSGGFRSVSVWKGIWWSASNPPSENEFFKKKFEKYLPRNLPPETQYFEWGIARIPGSEYHFQKIISPMANLTKPEEIDEYPFPDVLAEDRWLRIKREVSELKTLDVVIGTDCLSLFEIPWALRGMQNLMMDFLVNKDFTAKLMDWLEDLEVEFAKRFVYLDVDVICFGDDVGMQDRMILSPETWREWIKPRMKHIIDTAKQIKPDALIYYDSDGYIEPIIEDLIEIGVNVLAPLQPECMNIAKIKRRYSKWLSFKGSIGAQSIMPFGSPKDVKNEVKDRMNIFKDGGLFLCPSHTIEPGVPWENIKAFVEAVNEYGGY